ncbi:MAG: glycerate kinase [Pelolinea sp.]|nr:glycerate kinase [Pelolinea sp.]
MMIQIPSLESKWVEDINRIINQSLGSVDPFLCISETIDLDGNLLRIANSSINLEIINNIYILGVGKAVIPMAKAVESKIGKRITGGFLISKHRIDHVETQISPKIQIHLGGHPLPDERSIDCAKKLEKFVGIIDKNDLIINLISGGGSALMSLPYDGISLADIRLLTDILLKSGAVIQEINTIRKHIDRIKGGGLAIMTHPTQLVSLILSDVVGDEISMIASGPTIEDETTYLNAMEIIRKYNIENKIPISILNHIKMGLRGKVQETVKSGDKAVKNVTNTIIGSLSIAIDSAEKTAQDLGYNTIIDTKKLVGEAREIGKSIASSFINMYENDLLNLPTCFMAGGETTVTISGNGKGGRNQELVLSAIEQFENYNNCCMISIATDGEDGPTDAAGAFITGTSLKKAKDKGLDPQKYLINNDSYSFFEQIGNLIKIGPTGTNVNDLIFLFCFR